MGNKLVSGWDLDVSTFVGTLGILSSIGIVVKHNWTSSFLNGSESTGDGEISLGKLVESGFLIVLEGLNIVSESHHFSVMWRFDVLVESPAGSDTSGVTIKGESIIVGKSDVVLPWESCFIK